MEKGKCFLDIIILTSVYNQRDKVIDHVIDDMIRRER